MGIIEKFREANYVIIGVTFLLFLIGLVGLSSIAIHQDGTIQSSSFLKQMLYGTIGDDSNQLNHCHPYKFDISK